MKNIFLIVGLLAIIGSNYAQKVDIHEKNVRELERPFRMAKVNIIWEKALKSDLSNAKLEILLSELKIQDKQELTLKKMKSDGGDKDGQMEAQLRKSLSDIMDRYRLGNPTEVTDQKPMNALFKDKKLNKLWEKAEISGFTQEELKGLKEEFQHHQDKIDQYYELLHDTKATSNNELDSDVGKFDHLASMEEDSTPEAASVNAVREKHRSVKEGFSRLHKLASSGPLSKEFTEPKVAGLWRIAMAADFTPDELESLHTELKHYESKLLKVRHLTAEILRLHKTGETEDDHPDPEVRLEQKLNEASPSDSQKLLQERLKKQRRTVFKLHDNLEERILSRHAEL